MTEVGVNGDGTRIADRKAHIGARLPEILVGDCLERCFASGGLSATSTRPRRSMDGRRLFRFHLNHTTMEKVYTELVAPGIVDERLAPWRVIATALIDHLNAVDIGLPPDANNPLVSVGVQTWLSPSAAGLNDVDADTSMRLTCATHSMSKRP